MLFLLVLLSSVDSYRLPGNCEPGHFYEPTSMDCLACLVNASLVTSVDGFGCSCNEHSIPIGVLRCKTCNVTEVVTSDGTACVPRRCQSSIGRIICRKCPLGYISVSQNFDGSPMKEVQCIKCARGYKVSNNRCVKCEVCSCGKSDIPIKGKCVPKKYLLDRPKYSQGHLHSDELLEIVKLEFLCTQRDVRACRDLASFCVRNFYISDIAGPCRLWIQPKLANFTGLPLLTTDNLRYKPEFSLKHGNNTLNIIMAIHKYGGGFKMLTDEKQLLETCLPPIKITFGVNILRSCAVNVSKFTSSDYNDVFELYLMSENNLSPLPILIRKPNGYYIKKDVWSTGKFRKFFFFNRYRSTTANTTGTIYLATLLLRVIVDRDTSKTDSLQLKLSIETQYATKSPFSEIVTVLLRVEHDMPKAGILRGLEVCGGILGALIVLFALIQWRGAVKRGASYIRIIPILAGAISDVLYFAIFFSTFFAFATESGAFGFTLPLSQIEEKVIEILVYIAIFLKSVKVTWMNWNQCCCDIFFLDWSKYNSDEVISSQDKSSIWKIDILAREWNAMQTERRVTPGHTVTITLLVLYLLSTSNMKYSQGYKWVVTTATWLCSYFILLCMRFVIDKFVDTHSTRLVKLCTDLELSLLVFQEEYYAHYINGRNQESMHLRSMVHPLSSCRVVCAPQMRAVYKKLTMTDDITDSHSKSDLLSKFLAAFFERALDGLHWVASERTVLERLFDVEFVSRESGSTSVLLYDANISNVSCLNMTWWGEEWTIATFDAMLFGFVLIISDQTLLAALITIIVWKVMKHTRTWVGNWSLQRKINLIS